MEVRRATEPAHGAPTEAALGQRGTQLEGPTGPEIRPVTEWMKGARMAHELIVGQVQAGHSADQIAARWEQVLASYDDAAATPAQREWQAGARETAADMIQTWRDLQRAEAEQAQLALGQHQAAKDSPEPEAG
jgi:hypothetical protein